MNVYTFPQKLEELYNNDFSMKVNLNPEIYLDEEPEPPPPHSPKKSAKCKLN